MKQETLEEAAENYGSDFNLSFYNTIEEIPIKEFTKNSFIEGAKWMQERMYSEEDMREAYKSCYTPFSFDRIGDLEQDFKKWFEQFKKEEKQ